MLERNMKEILPVFIACLTYQCFSHENESVQITYQPRGLHYDQIARADSGDTHLHHGANAVTQKWASATTVAQQPALAPGSTSAGVAGDTPITLVNGKAYRIHYVKRPSQQSEHSGPTGAYSAYQGNYGQRPCCKNISSYL